MVEQGKSIDFGSRDATRIGSASKAVFDEVLSILDARIYRARLRPHALSILRDDAVGRM